MTMQGLDYDQLFPGRFIKAGDLGGVDRTLTIANVELEDLPQDQGSKVKGIVQFKEAKKALVLNRTNGECIKAMFGRKVDDWYGKRITLFPTEWNGEPCVRIKGSPDIKAAVTFELKLPKRKPKATTMLVTGKGKGATPAPPPPEQPDAEGVLPDAPAGEP
jgi:hypothetical protein